MHLSDVCLTSDVCLSDDCLVCRIHRPKSRTDRPRKTKIGAEVAHVTRNSDTTFKVKRSRSPGRFTHRRVGASGSCSGGHGNVLAVRNCCYVAVCSAARGASAPTRWGGEGRGHIVAAAHLQLVIVYYAVVSQYTAAVGCFFLLCLQGKGSKPADGQSDKQNTAKKEKKVRLSSDSRPKLTWFPLCLIISLFPFSVLTLLVG